MKTLIGSLIVLPDGEPIYSERATNVKMADEGGQFVEIVQHGDEGSMAIGITPDEWPALRSAINRMMKVAAR